MTTAEVGVVLLFFDCVTRTDCLTGAVYGKYSWYLLLLFVERGKTKYVSLPRGVTSFVLSFIVRGENCFDLKKEKTFYVFLCCVSLGMKITSSAPDLSKAFSRGSLWGSRELIRRRAAMESVLS